MSSSVLKKLLLVVLVAGAAHLARAQFVVDGSESAFLRWNQIKTEDYRFVYPAPFDSLARTYALEWERWKLPVSYSIGRVPNEAYRRQMPVILHPYLGYSNGMVVWTPRRMEMYTGPEMVNPWPLPWTTLLAIHEQRHVAQMQFVHQKPLKVWSYLSGEALAGFFSIYYFDPSHFEGDAVTTETALTQSGRARTADFLEYFRASFDEGEFRNYERWRYGSQRLFTPDYYKVGYLAIGGIRAVYDKPLFMKDYYDWLIPYRKQVRRQTGLKFKDAFGGVMAVQDSLWKSDNALRAPFQPMSQVTSAEPYYVSYSGLTFSGGFLYAVRGGIADDSRLVMIDPEWGSIRDLHSSGADSPLTADGSRLYWTETLPHPRWEMRSNSSIRFFENGSAKTLVRKGRWFNPKAMGDSLIVCRTGYDGSAYVAVLSATDGSVLKEFRAPDGLTPFEAVSFGPEILCAAVSESGQGIYRLPDFEPVLGPSFVEINHLFVFDDKLFFTSDRTGVNELYSLEGTEVLQHTCLKNGGKDFVFGDDGQLYFTYLRSDGRMVCRTPVDSLPVRAVDFYDVHKYELEDRLSAQEAALAAAAPADTAAPQVSAPRRYSKALHAIKIHSWLPFYADYDEVSSMSYESLNTSLGLGATAFFQNDLNTLYGSVGYNYLPGALMTDSLSLHSGVIDVTYRGLYPVFEGKIIANRTGMSSRLRAYVPLNFSSDGWSRGIVPSIEARYLPSDNAVRTKRHKQMLQASAGIRAYSVLPTLNSSYFPRLGVGFSAGVTKDFEFSQLLPYASLYGYLPGLWKTSGLGVSLSYSTEPYQSVSVSEKEGMSLGSEGPSTITSISVVDKAAGITLATTELRVNYAIPFLSVDWNGLSPVAYVRNFEFIPKGSLTHYNLIWDPAKVTPSGEVKDVNIWTAGAALDVVLGNFWFIPYKIRLGVSAVYVHGNPDPDAKPYEINLVLNVDL